MSVLFNIYIIDVDNKDNGEFYDNVLSTFKLVSWETMDVKIDEDFLIKLESNPTTGYSWQLDYGGQAPKYKRSEKYFLYFKAGLNGSAF